MFRPSTVTFRPIICTAVLQESGNRQPVPVAARSKAEVCDLSPAEIVGSNPTGERGRLPVVSVVYCQVEVSATS